MNIKKLTANPLNLSRLFLVGFIALLLLVLPQLNDREYVSSTVTTKFIYFLYGCLILAAIYSLILVFTKTIVLSFSKLDFLLLTLVLYITLNRYFIQSYFGFSIRYMELLCLCFFYAVLRSIHLRNYPWMLLAVIISGIIQAIYGNLQLLGYYASNHSGFKMTGSFFNPGPYAGFFASVWPVALGMFLYKDKVILQVQSQIKSNSQFLSRLINQAFEYIPLFGLISIGIVLPATQSRSAWLAGIVSSLVLLEARYHILKMMYEKGKSIRKTVLIISIIIILIIGLFGMYNFKKNSSNGRAFIWKVTTEMIADTPFFGVGIDQFQAKYMNYQANYFAKNGETTEALIADNTFYAFNEWLQFVAENGLIGFFLLMIVTFALIRMKPKKNDAVLFLIAKIGLSAISIFAFFSYPIQILPIKIIIIFLLAIMSNSALDTIHITIQEYSTKQLMLKVSLVLFASLAISQVSVYATRLSQSFITWNNGLTIYKYGDYNRAVQEFELSYSIFEKNGDFLINYGKALAMAGESLKAITVLKRAEQYQNNSILATTLGDSYKATLQYKKAENYYTLAVRMVPSRFYAHYLLAKLYDASGQDNKAVYMAKKLISKEIKIPSTAIKEMQEEMQKILLKKKKNL